MQSALDSVKLLSLKLLISFDKAYWVQLLQAFQLLLYKIYLLGRHLRDIEVSQGASNL